MIVSTAAHLISLDAYAARPSKVRSRVTDPRPRPDVAAILRRALIRNELLLNIAAAPRPTLAGNG